MTALLTRLQLTVALALLVFAALLSGCALSSWPVGWRGWLLVAVLAVWWAGVSVGEWVRGER